MQNNIGFCYFLSNIHGSGFIYYNTSTTNINRKTKTIVCRIKNNCRKYDKLHNQKLVDIKVNADLVPENRSAKIKVTINK
jgi:hypothetical protein